MADDKDKPPATPDTLPAKTGPLFVAVGQQGLRVLSENGTEWKSEQLGKEGETYRAVGFANGRFAAVGSYGGKNVFAVTADGKTWKTSEKDGQYRFYIRGMGVVGNTFWGIGGDPGSVGSSAPFVVTSADGLTWSDYVNIAGKHIIRRFAHGNDLFVGVGDRGRRAYSKDGKEWQDVPNVKALDTLVDIAFGNGVFAGVGLHGLRMTSTDGLKWSEPVRGDEGQHLNAVVWAKDRFVAVGMGVTYSSPDGVTWKRDANKDAPLNVIYGNGKFLGSNWRGRILYSEDGIEWRQVHKAEYHVEAIAFGA